MAPPSTSCASVGASLSCPTASTSSTSRTPTNTTITARPTTRLFAYDFAIRAFEARGMVALVAASVGYFMVLRGQTFAGHALSHVGFAGATGAALIGAAPLAGLIVFTVGAGAAIGVLGDRLSGRDVAIGIVLTLALGFGLLFLSLFTTHSTQATA